MPGVKTKLYLDNKPPSSRSSRAESPVWDRQYLDCKPGVKTKLYLEYKPLCWPLLYEIKSYFLPTNLECKPIGLTLWAYIRGECGLIFEVFLQKSRFFWQIGIRAKVGGWDYFRGGLNNEDLRYMQGHLI